MKLTLTKGIKKRIRVRWLASNERAGRLSRDYAWKQVETYLSNKKWIYAGMALTPLVGALLMAPFLHGAGRWTVVGVFGISGFWFTLLQVILRSEAASNVMGTDGEVSTAEVLRTLQRRGWRLINDVKVHPTFGIDHVAIGPAGILIIETKWARDVWPIDGEYNEEMSPRLRKAIWQANRGRQEFRDEFKELLEGVPINAVCVLWSAYYPPKGNRTITERGVEVLIGPALAKWVKNQENLALNEQQVERLWRAVNELVERRDSEESADGKTSRPTLISLLVDSVLAPIVEIGEGLLISLLGLIVIGNVRPSWLLPSSLIFICIGGLLRKKPSLRLFSLGWLGLSVTFCFAFFGIWAQHALTR